MTDKTTAPGETLRLFVRGFLRDHLGFSKIAADAMSALFIKRWLASDEKTAARYAREDKHTLVAAFDREAIAGVDVLHGGTTAADQLKVDVMKEKRSLADTARAELRFPNKPVFPRVPAMFGGHDPKVMEGMFGEHGLPDIVFVIDTQGIARLK